MSCQPDAARLGHTRLEDPTRCVPCAYRVLRVLEDRAQIRTELLARYQRNRERSAALFALLSDEVYYSQPIALRHPIVFYEGHLPGFSFNTLVKKALGGPGIDARLEALFARGIDPHESRPTVPARARQWPSRQTSAPSWTRPIASSRCVDERAIDQPGNPLLDRAKRPSRSSNTRRCTRKRCCTSSSSSVRARRSPRRVSSLAPRTVPAVEWVDIPAGSGHARRSARALPLRVGQRASRVLRRRAGVLRSNATM